MSGVNNDIALENRLTKIEQTVIKTEQTLDRIADTLKEISDAFKGHTHPEIERDYTQVKSDVNEIGQKVHRVKQDTEDVLKDFQKEINVEREKNLNQEFRLVELEKQTEVKQLNEKIKWFETKFWSALGTISVSAGVIIWQFLTSK